MPFLSRRAAEPCWEVIDHKEVAPVPAYFGGTGIEITSVSTHDVSQTYTFDASSPSAWSSPSSSRPGSPSSNGNLKLRPKLSITGSSGRQRSKSFFASLSRTSSNSSASSATSSSGDDFFGSGGAPTFGSSTDSVHGYRMLSQNIQMRDALVFAREQLLHSSEMKKAGGNVLFFEGWSVTRMKKLDRYRLQVRYIGRPAKATFSTSTSPDPSAFPNSGPPFMDLLEESWY